MSEIRGSSVLILGYGREGESTHRYLLRKYPGIKIGIADQQEVKPIKNRSVKLHLGKDYLKNLQDYKTIIRSPGISSSLSQLQECQKYGKGVTTETNIFFSESPGTIIGITGTKGKSTTTSLIAKILEGNYPDVHLVGNIGRPALDYLTCANKKTIFVYELSSYQLEDLKYSPRIAVLLNIVPEHLDRYGNFQNYVLAKANIIKRQKRGDFVVFNPAHEVLTNLVKRGQAEKFPFSLKKDANINCYVEGNNIFIRQDGEEKVVMPVNKIPLLGLGNLENTLAAISVGFLFNLPLFKIRQAVEKFKPLKHRLEFVGERRGIKFYNDSLATIPEATIHALEALGNDVQTLIAGGYDRGLDFLQLGQFLTKSKVETLILFPPTGEKIWKAVCQVIPKKNWRPKKFKISSMKEAVEIAFKTTSPGKICLLSPASASFGLFRDYEERGNLFKSWVLGFNQSPR